MDETKIKQFREQLLEMRKELLVEALKTVKDEGIKNKQEYRDFVDLAAAEADTSFYLRLKDRQKRLLRKIDSALQRIKDNTFGTCEECGEEIGIKRLEARPVTTMCIDCKTEEERDDHLKKKIRERR